MQRLSEENIRQRWRRHVCLMFCLHWNDMPCFPVFIVMFLCSFFMEERRERERHKNAKQKEKDRAGRLELPVQNASR